MIDPRAAGGTWIVFFYKLRMDVVGWQRGAVLPRPIARIAFGEELLVTFADT
jgi:hypothetical protein